AGRLAFNRHPRRQLASRLDGGSLTSISRALARCKAARCGVLSRARSLRLQTLPASLPRLLFAAVAHDLAEREPLVHLSAIKLRGFKSFPEPVEVRLERGVAVVVGPNGSGKSNVADAIVWAAGSLAPTELRAEKPDDVLYAGSGGRGQAEFCQVELLFDNTSGEGPIDYSELSIARRLHRGGEGQYLVNRTAVRRIDLVE